MELASTSTSVLSAPTSSSSTGASGVERLGQRKRQRLTEAVANFITREMLPYDIVERAGFKEMLKEFEPNYTVPGRKAFTETIIPRLTHALELKIKNLLSATNFIAITTDCWTSITMQPFIAVTAHFVDRNKFALTRVCLSCRKMDIDHTSENLKDTILDILEQWGLNDKIISGCTTDNGSNILKCMQLLSWTHLSCFGHVLNIGVNRIYKMNLLKEPIKKARMIQNAIAHSWQMKRNLKSIQERMELPQHSLPSVCETRWWSILKLLKVIVEQHAALVVLFTETRKSKYNNYSLTAEEIKNISTLITILEPLEQVCQHMCGEHYVTCSIIYPVYSTLTEKLNTINNVLSEKEDDIDDIDYSLSREIRNEICQSMSDRYDQPEMKVLLQTATFLDPRFKLDYFPNEKNKLVKHIKEEIIKFQPQILATTDPSTSSSCTSILDKKKSNLTGLAAILRPERTACVRTFSEIIDKEIDYYIISPTIELERDPLLWWNNYSKDLLNLKYIAEKYLILPGTSVPSERVFSCAGNIITDTRACLSAEHAEQLIFLSMNKNI